MSDNKPLNAIFPFTYMNFTIIFNCEANMEFDINILSHGVPKMLIFTFLIR